MSKEHNHILRKEFYERLPRQRATRDQSIMKEMEEAIKLQVNHKLLKEKIESTTGKKITLKDISNVKQNTRKDFKTSDLKDVVEYLQKQAGSTTDILTDSDNNFKGLFFQEKYVFQVPRNDPR